MTHTTNDAPVTVEHICQSITKQLAHDPFYDRVILPRGQWDTILAALASAPTGVNITVRQKTPVVADYGDNFLVAQVSADGKTVGIDHPCDAVWSDVDRAQTALRDYINERIAAQDKCPFKPRDPASAPAGDGDHDEWLRGDWYEKWQDATEDANDSLMATLEALRGRVERTILASLARPRAAVGEQSREAIARIIDPEAWQDVSNEDIYPAMLRRIAERKAVSLAKADAILALQSPPAKVEG